MRGRFRRDDQGAAAVEFALVSVLLFTLLFGIIQYGFLFYWYQAGASTAHAAARVASAGLNPGPYPGQAQVDGCTLFGLTTSDRGEANGLPLDAVRSATVTWSPSPAQVNSTATVELVIRPTTFNIPFVPMPDTFTSQAVSTVTTVGVVSTTCTWTNPSP